MSDKIRVHELVKELKKSSREVFDRLNKLGIPAKSNLSTLTPEQVNRVKESFGLKVEPLPEKKKKKPAKKKPSKKKKSPPKKPAKKKAPAKKAKKPAAKKAAKEKKTEQKKAAQKAATKKAPGKAAGVKTEKKAEPVEKKVVDIEEARRAVREKPSPAPKAAEPTVKARKRPAEKPPVPPKKAERETVGKKTEAPIRPQKKKTGKKIYRYRPKGARIPHHGAPPTTVAPKLVRVSEGITVKEFAQKLGLKPADVIKKLMSLGEMVTLNNPMPVAAISIISDEMGIEIKVRKAPKVEEFEEVVDSEEDLKPRPPVVTVMGHVDHGKTLLLDAIRKTDVASGEAGGITQHIGAYQITHDGKRITFIDTPGHESFTALRARGARVTDIAVLVVAADDGVMPQTIEAIDHAREAGVPIMVAVNKIDKANANPDQVRQQLTEYGLISENWGGETIFVDVSAKEKTNIDQLLEMVLLLAEMMELSANPDVPASGVVIESKLEKGKGPVATVLIKRGTAKVGDNVVVGASFGKIRAMHDDSGASIEEAKPSKPVEILGLSDVPDAGEEMRVVEEGKRARQISTARKDRKERESRAVRRHVSLENLLEALEEGETTELKLIVKADTHGSLEAVVDSLGKLEEDNLGINIIHRGVGSVTESDVMLAAASDAIVLGFHVSPTSKAEEYSDSEKVDVRCYDVIYKLTEDIEMALAGMLEPEMEERVIGRIEVRQIFKISRIGQVGGCYVTEGEVKRSASARVIRDDEVVHEGKIASLKRFKDDVRTVSEGYECGLILEDYDDLDPGDMIEVFEVVPAGE